MNQSHHAAEDQGPITVTLYSQGQAVLMLAASLGFAGLIGYLLFFGDIQGQRWVMWLTLGAMMIAAAISVRAMVAGARSLLIDGERIEIAYPNEVFHASASQLTEIRVFRKSEKGKESASIFFRDMEGTRRAFSIRLKTDAARRAVEWFERISPPRV